MDGWRKTTTTRMEKKDESRRDAATLCVFWSPGLFRACFNITSLNIFFLNRKFRGPEGDGETKKKRKDKIYQNHIIHVIIFLSIALDVDPDKVESF